MNTDSAPHPDKQIPGSATSFIGRVDDSGTVLMLMQDPLVRLVTILGTGGVGKTRFGLTPRSGRRKRGKGGCHPVPLSLARGLVPC